MTDFTQIKSDFVRKTLEGLEFNENNRIYIENLMKIEKLVTGTTLGLATGHIRTILKGKYPKEWDAIGMELNPKHITLKEEKEQESKENKKLSKKDAETQAKEEKKSERTWKLAGGK